MVGGLGQARDDLGRALGIDTRPEDNLLEEVGRDEAGAGKGGEGAVRVFTYVLVYVIIAAIIGSGIGLARRKQK